MDGMLKSPLMLAQQAHGPCCALGDPARRSHQMQRVVGTRAVIDQGDEVRDLPAGLASKLARHFEPEVVVLNPSEHMGVRIKDAAKLPLPSTVEHGPVQVASAIRGVAQGAGTGEVDGPGDASGIARVEQSLHGLATQFSTRDGRLIALPGHVGKISNHQLRRTGVAQPADGRRGAR